MINLVGANPELSGPPNVVIARPEPASDKEILRTLAVSVGILAT